MTRAGAVGGVIEDEGPASKAGVGSVGVYERMAAIMRCHRVELGVVRVVRAASGIGKKMVGGVEVVGRGQCCCWLTITRCLGCSIARMTSAASPQILPSSSTLIHNRTVVGLFR